MQPYCSVPSGAHHPLTTSSHQAPVLSPALASFLNYLICLFGMNGLYLSIILSNNSSLFPDSIKTSISRSDKREADVGTVLRDGRRVADAQQSISNTDDDRLLPDNNDLRLLESRKTVRPFTAVAHPLFSHSLTRNRFIPENAERIQLYSIYTSGQTLSAAK